MAAKASSSLSPCIRLIEESLLLPTQDVRLFASAFLLIFAHTFTFIAVAVHLAHPLATSLLADIQAALNKNTTTSSSTDENSAAVDAASWDHAKKLLLIYLAYLGSKLGTQLVVALAAAATYSGERLTRQAASDRLTSGGLLATAAVAGALELSLTALLVAPLVYAWTSAAGATTSASACGYYALVLAAALLLNACLGTVATVGVAASAADKGCRGVWALCRAWRLMAARRKEAAVLVFVVSVLPAVIYPAPVFSFSFVYPPEKYSTYYSAEHVLLLGLVSGSGLPSVGAQLLAVVAATVFCCLHISEMETSSAAREGVRPV